MEAAGDALRIGPGRASFSFSPTGRWVRFGPRDGDALIAGGGFVVYARGEGGAVTEVLDTRRGGVRVLGGARGLGKVHEGVEHGNRYPSARPDDDDDDLIDEDRLDGIDNDGDGRIDEDYAAIGDEMVVTAYEPVRDAAGSGAATPAIQVHQESYAWSLQQIDGMVVTRLMVRNAGTTPIEDLRVGAVFPRRDDFTVDTQDFGTVDDETFRDQLVSKGIRLHSGDESVAVIFFSPVAHDAVPTSSWLTGVTQADRNIASLVEASSREDALARPDRRPEANDAPSPAAGIVPGTGAGTGAGSAAGDAPGFVAWGVSPPLGTLEPGQETFIFVAMVMPPSVDRAARSIDFAYRTVVGDGNSRLIPPPVSVKRRTVWGTYETDYTGDVTLTLLDPRAHGVNPVEIAFLKGFDMGRAIRSETPDGNTKLELKPDRVPADFAEKDRVILHGRMQDGEWFDAILQPAPGGDEGRLMSAEQYFNRPGKLDEAWIDGSPNPFRDATTIHYQVPSQLTDEHGNELSFAGSIETSVKVYNVTGRLVNTLVDEIQSPGQYQTQWHADNEVGSPVASGVYYVKLQIGRRFVTKRLIQLK